MSRPPGAAADRRPLSLQLYGLATQLASPLAAALLARRERIGKEDPERLGERLGHTQAQRPQGAVVWLHAVSVGESVSLLPLIDRLALARPDVGLLVTSGTRTAAEILRARLPDHAVHQYAPVDTPGAVRRFLDHWRPALGVFVESELWPNLLLAARDRGVRLALVSARMTQESARGWAARPKAARAVLGAFELVLPQDEASADRLAALGARVDGRLNLKRAGEALGADLAELARLQAQTAGRRVLLAASTHAGEETLAVSAWATLPDPPLLVIAPRHPDRREAILTELGARRLAVRSRGEAIAGDTEIYLADTLGELGLLFRLADLVLMGGGFVAGVGGHNPLEPARLGAPVVSGGDVPNHAAIYAEMVAADAAVLTDAAGLPGVLRGLLNDADARARMATASLAYAQSQGAEFERAVERLLAMAPAL